ncbi:N-acetylmuramic acid 6-phosphate etherase [Pararhodobacter sp.]|uniref:N-acetylmuramic acid 6-phosphate etherase n=1 Tax=Pararhodobacter sp. TaxID=2127056 RepID=UPI002AFE33E4|nr:N-acetylmuramic acid 6-phosphate etherase [Pararhodobacter sp.]
MSSTETAAARFSGVETWPTADLADALLETQLAAASAAASARDALARAIDAAAMRLAQGGRLVYLGAGTSGRLAVLDAAELPPTFDWPPARAVAVMAGGERAILHAVEGAEDDGPAAIKALNALAINRTDVVIGVAASGRTPFARAGLAHARNSGALTIGIFNAAQAPMHDDCDIALLAETGAEIIAGSTRMKAGTAQKILLNCLSTGVMIRLGYVYRGRMVEMRPTNAKLQARAVAMVADLTGASVDQATDALTRGETIKVAVVMLGLGLDAEAARARLAASGGILARALAG